MPTYVLVGMSRLYSCWVVYPMLETPNVTQARVLLPHGCSRDCCNLSPHSSVGCVLDLSTPWGLSRGLR